MNTTSSRTAKRLLLAVVVLGVIAVLGWGGSRYWQRQQRLAEVAVIRAQAKPGDIFMYSQTTCGDCVVAKRWLNEQKVPFEYCEIDVDKACEQRLAAIGQRITPTLLVRGQKQVGFQPERVALALAPAPKP